MEERKSSDVRKGEMRLQTELSLTLSIVQRVHFNNLIKSVCRAPGGKERGDVLIVIVTYLPPSQPSAHPQVACHAWTTGNILA